MINLPAISESTLAISLEGVWALPVVLTGPDGVQQTARGQVLRENANVAEDSRGIAQGSRQSIVTSTATVTLRRSSLNPVPQSGEHWTCAIPASPVEGAPMQTMLMEEAISGSATLGMVILKLVEL